MTPCDDLTAALLSRGPYRGDAAQRRCVRAAGPDAVDYLQRLCTQDVASLGDRTALPAAFLDARGKVQVTCHALRLGDALWLETQAPQHPRLLELLDHYHFTEKVTFTAPAGWTCGEWVGMDLPEGTAAGSATPLEPEGFLLATRRRGVVWIMCHGPAAAVTATLAALPSASPLPADIAEALRMGAGYVRVGTDTEASTLALEADLADHCSTTKGCYTGQEIVARIQTYGHVNRRLCLLHIAGTGAISTPMTLCEPADRIPVGRVMHAVQLSDRPLRVGLGYLPEDFQAVGTQLVLESGEAVSIAGY
jgi:tRNA-modifying protein YgfZ